MYSFHDVHNPNKNKQQQQTGREMGPVQLCRGTVFLPESFVCSVRESWEEVNNLFENNNLQQQDDDDGRFFSK